MTTARHVRIGVALACAIAIPSVSAPASARGTATAIPTPQATRPAVACRGPGRAFAARIPGHPFDAVTSPDGCELFVGIGPSGGDPRRGIVVLRRTGRSYAFVRTLDVGGAVAHLAISADGRSLAASVLDRGVVLLDAARAVGGDPSAVVADLTGLAAGRGVTEPGPLVFTNDGSRVYVADRPDSAIVAIDVAAATAASTSAAREAVLDHRVALDREPVGLALSPSGDRLYAVTATRSEAKNVAEPCHSIRAIGGDGLQPPGVLAVLEPANGTGGALPTVTSRLDVGCSPDAVALTPDGATIYVAATGDRQLIALEAAALGRDEAHATIARTSLTFGPDALAVVDHGAFVLAAGYHAASDLRHELAVMPSTTALGRTTQIARLGVERFPRAIVPDADGDGGIVVVAYGSPSLAFYPLASLRSAVEPGARRSRPTARPRVTKRVKRVSGLSETRGRRLAASRS